MTEGDIADDELRQLRMTLGRLGRVLRQQTDETLTYPIVALIFNIFRSQPVTAGELATTEGISQAAVTRHLKRLEELGYVTREVDPRDRRSAMITLSALGDRERTKLLKRREEWLMNHLTRLNSSELRLLLDALPALARLCDPELPRGLEDEMGTPASAR